MAIQEHPAKGTLLLCRFEPGFEAPEMVNRRPVVVVSPKIGARPGLCTVVAISTQQPSKLMPYRYKLRPLTPNLPHPYNAETNWIKGDMIYAVGFSRLDFFHSKKLNSGKRKYRFDVLPDDEMKNIQRCILAGLGLGKLTKHL